MCVTKRNEITTDSNHTEINYSNQFPYHLRSNPLDILSVYYTQYKETMKTNHQEYQPVATAVPTDSILDDDDGNNLVIASVAADDPLHIETPDGVATRINEQLQEQRGRVPSWTDPYFEGRQDVWGVFDFDSKALITEAFKINVGLLTLLVMLMYLVGIHFSWPLLTALFILSWNTHRAAVGTHTTRHLALTRDGLLFVHEKHRTWYGMKGYTEQLIPYAEINAIETQYATGDVVFCFNCNIDKFRLRQYEALVYGDNIEGVKEAKVLVDILHKLCDAPIHVAGLRSSVPDSPSLELSSGAHPVAS